MKLLRCYVENFGVLHQYQQTFRPGITTLQQPNGFGKTTLTAFLCAMLYGLPRGGKADLNQNPRRKYAPWQGGRFGGYLEFEQEGTAYRVERYFGQTPAKDTFDLYTLQPILRKSNAYSSDLGLELFGLDEDSFRRSIYLPQAAAEVPMATDHIRQKLAHLVEESDDITRYDKAVEALRAKRSSFVPYRGNGGLAGQTQAEITQLQARLEQQRAAAARLAPLAAEQTRLEAAIAADRKEAEQLTAEIQQLAQAKALYADWQAQQRLAAEEQAAAAGLQAMEEKYPAGLPAAQELERAGEILRQAEQLAPLPETEELRQAKADVARYAPHFASELPSEEALEQQTALCQQYREAAVRLDAHRLAPEQQAQWQQLRRCFEAGLPAEDALAECQNALAEAETLRAQSVALLEQQTKRTPPTAVWVCAALGLAAAGAAAYGFTQAQPLWGGLGAAVAVALLAAAAFFALRRPGAAHSAALQANNERITLLEQQVHGVLQPYALPDAPLSTQLRQLQNRMDDYTRLAEAARRAEEAAHAAEQLRTPIDEFFRPYWGTVRPEDYLRAADTLKKAAAAYRRATEQVQAARQQEADRAAQRQQLLEKLERFARHYRLQQPIDYTALQAVRDDTLETRRLAAQLAQRKEAYAASVQQQGVLPQPPAFDPQRLEQQQRLQSSLQQQVDENRQLFLQNAQQLKLLREAADAAPLCEDLLERRQRQLDQAKHNAGLLDKTIAYLEQARSSLSERYLAEIKAAFAGYLRQIPWQEGKLQLADDLTVQLEQNGTLHPLASFSAGCADLVQLCMRFALADALFAGKETFLLLDDPFVNLDNDHLDEAKEALRLLARNRQIVYLTCHSSRKL